MIVRAAAGDLSHQAHVRLGAALRPSTASADNSRVKLFPVFVLWLKLLLDHVGSVLRLLELLAQNGSRAHTFNSYVLVILNYAIFSVNKNFAYFFKT